MVLNNWQNTFLTKFVPILESLGSVVEIFAFIVLFVLLPALIFSCYKIIGRCHAELKRQNHLLQSQTQTVNELNNWMQYFDEKINKREKTSPPKRGEPEKVLSAEKVVSPKKRKTFPDKKGQATFPSTPVSIYKKTI